MVKVVIGTIGILGLASCNYAVADSPCDYVKDVQTNWTQQIEKTSNIDKKVFPYVVSSSFVHPLHNHRANLQTLGDNHRAL